MLSDYETRLFKWIVHAQSIKQKKKKKVRQPLHSSVAVYSSMPNLVYTVHLAVCAIVCERVRSRAPRAVVHVWGAKR
jgi:hypothetical protein